MTTIEAVSPPSHERAVHETVLQPTRGWSALRLHELWEYRDLLVYLTWRDLQTRYRQMALGPLWIIIQPLLSMVLYTAIFGQIAKLPSDGKPYAVFGVSTDITERKRMDSALLESRRHYQALAESLPHLVWTCRSDGYCDYLSQQWVHYTGRSAEEQLGSGWGVGIHPVDHARVDRVWGLAV